MHAYHCEYFHFWNLHSSEIHVRYIQLMDFVLYATLHYTLTHTHNVHVYLGQLQVSWLEEVSSFQG